MHMEDKEEDIEEYIVSERIRGIDEEMEKLQEYFNTSSLDDSNEAYQKSVELYSLQDEMSELIESFPRFFS